jgi:DNA polymerase-1
MLLQVHDELVLETPPEEIETIASLVRTTMEDAYELAVPLRVDVEVGPNWRDLTPIGDTR